MEEPNQAVDPELGKQIMIKEHELERRLDNFEDVEGISTRNLNIGLWYLQHRRIFFLAIVWFLAITATILWCYSLYYFGYYLLVGLKQERVAGQSLVTEIPRAVRKDLMSSFYFKTIDLINLGNNSFELLGEVDNQNLKSWATFDYYFLVDGNKVGAGSSFILPQSKKFVIAVLDGASVAPDTSSLVVYNIRWVNLNSHLIPDWVDYRNAHLNFSVIDKKFVNANLSSLSDRLPMNTISFSVINQTAYSYLEAPFQVILYSGDTPVGVKDYVINNFKSRDRKQVNLTIVGNFPNVTQIEVLPDINILDTNNLLKAD